MTLELRPDLAAASVREVDRLRVGALDQPDPWLRWRQRLRVQRRAAQGRLDGQPGLWMSGRGVRNNRSVSEVGPLSSMSISTRTFMRVPDRESSSGSSRSRVRPFARVDRAVPPTGRRGPDGPAGRSPVHQRTRRWSRRPCGRSGAQLRRSSPSWCRGQQPEIATVPAFANPPLDAIGLVPGRRRHLDRARPVSLRVHDNVGEGATHIDARADRHRSSVPHPDCAGIPKSEPQQPPTGWCREELARPTVGLLLKISPIPDRAPPRAP
jgi:hypothetical protein